jgi:autotransporter-associated beta strand protein
VVVRYQGSQIGTGGTVSIGTGAAAGYTVHSFTGTGTNSLNFSGLNLDARLKTTLTGVVSGSGNLTYDGPGTLILAGNNTYTGGTSIHGGTLEVSSIADGAASHLGTEGYLAFGGNGGTFRYAGTGAQTSTRTLWFNIANASAAIDVSSATGTLTLSSAAGTRDQNFTKLGAGRLNLGGAISGNATVTVNGGTLSTTASNSYTGATTISGGTLIVDTGGSISSSTTVGSGAHLKVNGVAGAVNVNGTLSGSGTVGAMTLNSGATLAVGNSPGLMTATSATWNAGSVFQFEIVNATGTAGTDWDLLSVTGALDLTSISAATKMNLTVLSTGLLNYNSDNQYSWVFAKAASLTGAESWASGLDVTDRFAISSSGFNGGTQPGRGFKVLTGTEGGFATLSLQAVPEPASGTMLLAGMVAWGVMRRWRTR